METETGSFLNSSKPTTFQSLHRPWLIRFLNQLVRTIERCGVPPVSLSEKPLLAAACRRTGLSDWGDESFRAPMKILLESFEEEVKDNPLGRLLIRGFVINVLARRLRIQDELKRHPEILREQIRRPLFITGLPRTGTTLLQNLLSQDPSSRTLLTWEAISPIPPPESQTRENDPRISRIEWIFRMAFFIAPGFLAIHPSNARAPEECTLLLQNTFFCRGAFELASPPKQYAEWFEQQDMVPPYRYYRQLLQLLQWRCPGDHWVLKSPVHLPALDALLTVFPDACVVQTHRDLTKVVPSCCSLFSSMMRIFHDQVDLGLIGQKCTNQLARMLERGAQMRDSSDPTHFYDVYYRDLLKDPIGTVRQIYTHFGYNLDVRMEEGMRRWLSENPQNKHGVHRYSLEQFFLDPETLKSKFANYYKRFNIPTE